MTRIEDLEKEVILRIVQLHHSNITHDQAKRLIAIAFSEYRGEVGSMSSTDTRLNILGGRTKLLE